MSDKPVEMSDDNIINLADRGFVTYADETPESALAKAWGMTHCVIVGYDKDGDLRWGGSTSDAERINWLLDCAKRDLLSRLP